MDRTVDYESLLRAERILIAISNNFLSLPSFSDAADASISEIGRIFQAKRVFLELLPEKRMRLPTTYYWCRSSVKSAHNLWSRIPVNSLSWLLQTLESVGYIWIQDVRNLPPEAAIERKLLKQQDIRSLLGLPLRIVHEITGFLSITDMQKISDLSEEELSLLRACAEIMSASLSRTIIEHELRERVQELNYLCRIAEIVQRPDINLKETFNPKLKEVITLFQR